MSDYAVVPFYVEEADVNLLDGTAYDLGTAEAPDTMVLVPIRLEIHRAAGTAYTVTHATGVPVPSKTLYLSDAVAAEPLWAGVELVIYSLNTRDFSGRSDREAPLFRVPIYDFLNSASEMSLVVLPEGGVVLHPGDLELRMESLAGLSGGTGTVSGRVVFERVLVERGPHGR